MAELTANALKLLLTRLDAADPTIAGEKYQLLVLKITKYFIWQGSPESIADNLAESAIDRLAEKLEQGVVIENLNAYVHQIARFVWLEHERKHRETQWTDDVPEPAVEPQTVQSDDIRLDCLRK